jgi:hypothetical protein
MGRPSVSEYLGRRLSLASALKTFIKIEAFLVLACVATESYCNSVLHLSGAFIYPFLDRGQTFWDFTIFRPAFRHFHHSDFFSTVFPFMYPAPVAVALEFFFYLPRPLIFFVGFIILSFVISGIMLGRALERRGAHSNAVFIFIASSLLLAYPLWFELKQGNAEIFVWVLVTIGVWAFFKGRNYSSAVCIGIAGSIKLFPFVYLGLLLSTRKYREVVFALLIALIATITSLWLLGGDIVGTWHHIQSNLDQFRVIYMLHVRKPEIGFDHSLFAVYKRFWLRFRGEALNHFVLNLYLAFAAVSGMILYFTKIRRLPLINQVLCLCVASILLPPVSGDYTLMHLYVPWGLLVLFAQEQWNRKNDVPGLTIAFVCFAILMAPESEFIYHAVRFGGQIKAITLIVLMYIAMKYPVDESALDLTNARPGHPLSNRPNLLNRDARWKSNRISFF